jgi:hypothetical protein
MLVRLARRHYCQTGGHRMSFQRTRPHRYFRQPNTRNVAKPVNTSAFVEGNPLTLRHHF